MGVIFGSAADVNLKGGGRGGREEEWRGAVPFSILFLRNPPDDMSGTGRDEDRVYLPYYARSSTDLSHSPDKLRLGSNQSRRVG